MVMVTGDFDLKNTAQFFYSQTVKNRSIMGISDNKVFFNVSMSQFILYAHRNATSDNMVQCERKVHKMEGSKNAGLPRVIL